MLSISSKQKTKWIKHQNLHGREETLLCGLTRIFEFYFYSSKRRSSCWSRADHQFSREKPDIPGHLKGLTQNRWVPAGSSLPFLTPILSSHSAVSDELFLGPLPGYLGGWQWSSPHRRWPHEGGFHRRRLHKPSRDVMMMLLNARDKPSAPTSTDKDKWAVRTLQPGESQGCKS